MVGKLTARKDSKVTVIGQCKELPTIHRTLPYGADFSLLPGNLYINKQLKR